MKLPRWKKVLFTVLLIPLTISLSGCAIPPVLAAITNVLSGIGSVFAGFTAVTQGAQAVGDALSGDDDDAAAPADNPYVTIKTTGVETTDPDEPVTKKTETKSQTGKKPSANGSSTVKKPGASPKICTQCKVYQTEHWSGLCDDCLRMGPNRPNPSKLCTGCLQNQTPNTSGICDECQKKAGINDPDADE